jgi:hypothetical protein
MSDPELESEKRQPAAGTIKDGRRHSRRCAEVPKLLLLKLQIRPVRPNAIIKFALGHAFARAGFGYIDRVQAILFRPGANKFWRGGDVRRFTVAARPRIVDVSRAITTRSAIKTWGAS